MPDRLQTLQCRLEAATRRNWTYRLQQLGRPDELPFWRVQVPHRGRLHTRLCLASGIHGDEPAGTEAMLRLIENQEFPHGVAVDCFPCMNPTGAAVGRREDAAGLDLNRQFGVFSAPDPVKWFLAATEQTPYDLYVDLHEDSRSQGFYLFESPLSDQRLAPTIAGALTGAGYDLECPDDLRALIIEDGFDRYGTFQLEEGVAIPSFTTLPDDGLPQAAYMRVCRGTHTLTLETPASQDFEARVQMHLAGVRALFSRLKGRSHFAPPNPQREWVASEPARRPWRAEPKG